MASTPSQARTIPGQWVVQLKPYATSRAQAKHLSFVNERTADETPFNCTVRQEFDLDEARGYAASFDDATKEEIEKLSEASTLSLRWP
jgi:hypothetical protein